MHLLANKLSALYLKKFTIKETINLEIILITFNRKLLLVSYHIKKTLL